MVVFAAVAVAAAACYTLATSLGVGGGEHRLTVDPISGFRCRPLNLRERLELVPGSEGVRRHRVSCSANDGVARPNDRAAVQLLFDQGLFLRFGFNEVESNASFVAAAGLDPECSMCWWGIAYANSPHQNKIPGLRNPDYPVFTDDDAAFARSMATKGLEAAERRLARLPATRLTTVEWVYLKAMVSRFPEEGFSHARQLIEEFRYAAALVQIWNQFPEEIDAVAMAAEALMGLSPWEYHRIGANQRPVLKVPPHGDGTLTWRMVWEELMDRLGMDRRDWGRLAEEHGIDLVGPPEVLGRPAAGAINTTVMTLNAKLAEQLILKVLEVEPGHQLALHLHVHITEASIPGHGKAGAELGEKSADVLREMNTKSGHLVHMPSHLYLRVGRYQDAAEANIDAWGLDLKQAKRCLAVYIPEHNLQLLIYAASMAGMLSTAEHYAEECRSLPQKFTSVYVLPGGDWTLLPLVWVRYGQWEKLQSIEKPLEGARGVSATDGYGYSLVVYHFVQFMTAAARQVKLGMPHTTRKLIDARLDPLSVAFNDLEGAVRLVKKDILTKPGAGVGIYSGGYHSLSRILLYQATSQKALLEGNMEEAISAMNESVKISDLMGYMEPPRLHQPGRQCLGLLLLHARRPQEAEEVFQEDLWEYPDNPWSLLGLAQSMKDNGKYGKDVLDTVRKRFERAWKGEPQDYKLISSCPMISVSA